jgi:thiosulfate/3-mercaptopyruvate sulfurtransferase
MTDYAQPQVLVSTAWVKEHLGQPGIRLVEIDVDTQAYNAGHIPGAVGLNWQTQLQDRLTRDIISREKFEALLSRAGITPDDTVVLYGDNSNWFAAYGFWLFKVYGHRDVRLMDGGRGKWLAEEDKELTTVRLPLRPSQYKVGRVDLDLRARLPEVMEMSRGANCNLVDVRSPEEFTGQVIAPPGMSETAQRGGHIPGAKNVPWNAAVNADGTFKSADELRKTYLERAGIDPQKGTIAYCRIGERSSHTWFVLTYLLGLANVKNYDGSWTEYGNLIGVPIGR